MADATDLPLTAAPAPAFEVPVPEPAGHHGPAALGRYLTRTARLRAGIARWAPGGHQPIPPLPGTLTVEES